MSVLPKLHNAISLFLSPNPICKTLQISNQQFYFKGDISKYKSYQKVEYLQLHHRLLLTVQSIEYVRLWRGTLRGIANSKAICHCFATLQWQLYNVCDLESLSFFCIQKPLGVETWLPVESFQEHICTGHSLLHLCSQVLGTVWDFF